MGLRTASVRGEVMAPALTDQAGQIKLPPPIKGGANTEDALEDLIPETLSSDDIMSQMDQNMGLKTNVDSVSKIQEKNEVDQLINNLTSNADVDLMQVMKSIDNEHIDNFLDVMNISMEDQELKETQTKDLIAEAKKKQNKIERRLDFLRRKIRKIQARHMGQHVSDEVAGVYEYVHRTLKHLKDSTLDDDSSIFPPNTSHQHFRPISTSATKSLLKKLEMTATLQANSVSRQRPLKYFGSGSTEPTTFRINNVPGIVELPSWPPEYKAELQKVSGLLHSEIRVVQQDIDSEATESSSGGESCDEFQNYTNPHQQYLSIQKRALWKFATSRAAIANRWAWLQAQVADLEYRIRQHSDFHRQIRSSKGEIQLGGVSPPPPCLSPPPTVNGYRGQLPGATSASDSFLEEVKSSEMPVETLVTPANGASAASCTVIDYQCARTRPLINFKKRRLLQINGLHIISKKAARPSTVQCGCVKGAPQAPCVLCTGRTDPTYPRDAIDALSKMERVSLVDGGFHPVISLPEDISHGIHCEAIMRSPDWQQRCVRMKLKHERSDKSHVMEHRSKKIDHRKKYNRLLKASTVSALSAKIKSKLRGRKPGRHSLSSSSSISLRKRLKLNAQGVDTADEEVESIGNHSSLTGANPNSILSPNSSPLLHIQAISNYNRKNRANSYDIDNIVIPYSVAASTRVEKLQYKEILTPKWRIAEDFKCDNKNNGAVATPSQDSDVEDMSEEAIISRHDRAEYEEKKKFLSYLKFPYGYKSRSHKRTDSLAESSGANTPDPMSPHAPDHHDSPLTSPPATPLPEESLPSVSAMRKRTVSQSRFGKEREGVREENGTLEPIEVAPYNTRTFPFDDETYDDMLKCMPENHQFTTNARAQDSNDSYDDKIGSPLCSESTESAMGDEDPNDPEWIELDRRENKQKR